MRNQENALALIGSELGNVMVTMDMTAPGAKDTLYNALSAPTAKLSAMIGKTIKIRHIYAENVEGLNEETGEVENYTMIIIFDTEGKSYICSSTGMKNALRRAISLYGDPSTSPEWENGLEFEILQIETKKGRTFTLSRVF